ncbi:hypothetical protein PLCT2_01470 [Planctomycetaceae bacterium]|nr:hypothetical protein PLCT2_01470 [Planctomycetaceae bacterium]
MTPNSKFKIKNSKWRMADAVQFIILNFAFCIGASSAGAQAIDHDETRLLSAPNGRPGCYAPLQVVFNAPDSAKSALVESISEGVVLTRQVNIDKPGRITTRLPWLVAKGSKVRVTINGQSDEFTPPMPSRPQPPSYGRIYAAVFAPDIAKARKLVPPGDDLTCDFFKEDEAFEDWRMLDGYDAVVCLNSPRLRPPVLRALAHFATLGGVLMSAFNESPVLLLAGGFEAAPKFERLKLLDFWFDHAITAAGALYHLRDNSQAAQEQVRKLIIAAIRNHRWRGDDLPPAGPAPSRAVAEPYERGWLHPQGQEPPSAPAMFFALAGLALLLTALGPIVAARLTSRSWVAPLAIALGATALCGLGLLQSGPPATVEVFTVESRSGDVASSRSYVTCEEVLGSPEIWTINLDAEGPRLLARSAPARVGCRAWVVDTPLTKPLESGKAVELRNGMIENSIFRDYAAKARRGQAHFDEDPARILDWWLEANAYRGRDASMAPAIPSKEPLADWPNTYWRMRGAITVTPLRK